MNRDKFNNDLKSGQRGERIIADYFINKYGMELKSFNNDKRYDIVFSYRGRDITFEVKTDEYERYNGKTGNLFIETSFNGQVSGIWTTEAHWWVYYLPDLEKAYCIRVEKLRDIIKNNPLRRVPYAGDKGLSKGFLLSRDGEIEVMFKKDFIIIDIKDNPLS